jgi:isoleucyl-tRNA synthetase
VRNTFRFLLGNLHDYSPGDAPPAGERMAVDHAFEAHLGMRLQRMRQDCERFLFHRMADALLDVCTVDLSSVFLDAAKDRLYTLRPGDPARRSAQAALWEALRGLAVAASPLLAFTAEEVWQSHPALVAEAESVHLAEWPVRKMDEGAAEDWPLLLAARAASNAAIEPLRVSKSLATTLEAEVELSAPAALAERLSRYREELPAFLLAARVSLVSSSSSDGFTALATRTGLPRCDRCWTYREDVQPDAAGGRLCARCVAALQSAPAAGSGA